MKQRMQKILSQRGICSRRKAEELISSGRVTCNGITVRLGDSADPQTDKIAVDGRELPGEEKPVYLMLHKPRGYVTTLSDEKGRRTAASLVRDCGVRVYPVGRLDMDSEGLLLFTNDGAFCSRLTHPSKELDKVYYVWVRGFQDSSLELLSRRVVLDGYRIQAPQLGLLERTGDRACIQVTIHEGRNRQIRRMCGLAGMKVLRLKRVREGPLALGDLPLGAWRYLTESERKSME